MDISKQKITFHIEPLKGEENYELWSIRIDSLLAREGLTNYIKYRDYGIEPTVENEEPNNLNNEAIKTTSLIKLNLYDGPLLQIRHITKPFDVWAALENLYSPKGFSSEFLLCKELFDTTLQKSSYKMEIYLNQVKRLYDQLTAKSINIPEKVIFAWVLNNLSPEYETLITTITQSIRVNGADSIKLTDLFANLIDESKRIKYKELPDQETALWFTKNYRAKNGNQNIGNRGKIIKNDKKTIKCQHCNKKGHKIDKCWIKNPELRPNTKPNQEINSDLAMISNLDELDTAEDNQAFLNYSDINQNIFILDSGATSHICCNKSAFIDLKPIERFINWGKASKIKASGIGKVSIIFKDTNQKAVLNNCLFVPEFEINLISLSNLINKDFEVYFSNKSCKITKFGKLISNCKSYKGLYIPPINFENISQLVFTAIDKNNNLNKNDYYLWHKRLGHIGQNALNKLGFKDNNKDNNINCHECLLAKAKKHINHQISTDLVTEYFNLINSDLFGPVQVPSFGNKRYFITFLDKYTKWLEIAVLGHKNDAFKAFKEYLLKEENLNNKKLKIIRTDNGTEYNEFTSFCKERGIIHQKTAPYAHEQAGAGERINLTLLNKIRAILYTAKLNIKFWAEALEAIVYIYNRTPHKSLNYKTPFELKYNKKANINNIKIWGSICYSHNYSAKKLDFRAKPYILIGYGQNQLKLYDFNKNRAFWSRDTNVLEGLFLDKLKDTKPDLVNLNLKNIQFKGEYNNKSDIILKNIENTDNNEKITPYMEIETQNVQIDETENYHNTQNQNYDNTDNFDYISLKNLNKTDYNIPDNLSEDELAFPIIGNITDPNSYSQAINSPLRDSWYNAMEKEINSLKTQNTWDLIQIPNQNINILKGRWVFKTKLDQNGNILKYKARWVAKGFQQKYGIDFIETFSNTVKPMVYRTLFALAAYLNLEIKQWDIISAFPNAPLNEKIYIIQPEGFEDGTNRICLLNKALYGLKQAARQFYIFLLNILQDLGFKPLISDESVFYNNETGIIIAAHIDDLLIFSNNLYNIDKLKSEIIKKVEISDLNDIKYYLGIEIIRNKPKKELFLSQSKYINELLYKFKINGDKPIYNPTIQGIRLEKNTEQANENTIKLYQQQIGSLIYLMTSTRPDIAFAVNNCARFMSNPNKTHFLALNRIWQYIKTTKNRGILYKPISDQKPELIGYVDSDWGGDFNTRKSTTGYLFLIGNSPVSWSSKLQKTVALSSCEAEYMALKEASKELIWLKSFFNQINILKDYKANIIYCDNKSAIDLSKNPEHHAKTKHIDIQYHFVRDCIKQSVFNLYYINTKEQLADALTKALNINDFNTFINNTNICDLNKGFLP